VGVARVGVGGGRAVVEEGEEEERQGDGECCEERATEAGRKEEGRGHGGSVMARRKRVKGKEAERWRTDLGDRSDSKGGRWSRMRER